jgi:multidrug efflux pump subunit AcrA (membrane-fusion protein)
MPRGPVTVVSCDPQIAEALREAFDVRTTDSADTAGLASARVLVVGARLGSDAVRELAVRASTVGTSVVVIASHGSAPAHDTVFFSLTHEVAPADLRAVVAAALGRSLGLPTAAEVPPPPAPATNAQAAHDLHRVLTASRGVAAQAELGHAAAHVVTAVRDLTQADRAYCWFYDADSGELWRHGETAPQAEIHANRGLVGFVARTARSVCIANTAADPRFAGAVDDPAGRGAERFVAEPVIGPDRQVHAVLVGVRRRSSPPFDDGERSRLSALASCCGPAIHQLGLQLENASGLGTESEPQLYRHEAVESHARRHLSGDVIRIVPGWVPEAYVSVVLFVLAAVAYAVLGRIDHYSTGPAVVRIVGRTELTASTPGTIAEVMVAAGDEVEAGAILVRLYEPEPAGDRLQREFDGALRDHLRDEDDAAAGQTLRGVRSQLEQADDRRESLLVRAPHAAVVGDMRVRVGQAVSPGDIVASLVAAADELQLVAILPGSDRPMLARGMPLRVEIRGFPHAYDDLVIDTVAQEIVGPAELQRMLGPVAEGLGDTGAAVVVRARLRSTGFVADRGTFAYYDGMLATAHVRLRRQRVLDVLIPGFDDRGDGAP